MSYDLLILGAGPAGRALAAEACDLGLRTLLLDPALDRPWEPTYAAWADELPSGVAAQVWPRVMAAGHELDRPYALVDGEALREHLRRPRLEARAQRVLARVARGEHVEVDTDGGRILARYVVDASGHQPALVRRQDEAPLGWQTAFGWVLELDTHPFELDRMVFLDPSGPDHVDPSFLYAMPLGPRRVFVEETSLIARRAPSFELLRSRLEARLVQLGVQGRVLSTERCCFPMGSPMPLLGQQDLGTGASAGFVHPATGYSLAASLSQAPLLAQALAEGLDAAAIWARLWPQPQLRTRALHSFGARVLLDLDQAGLRRFFEAFFRLPDPLWRAYLRIDSPPSVVASAMSRVFAEADLRSRLELVAAGLSPSGLQLVRSLFTPGGP